MDCAVQTMFVDRKDLLEMERKYGPTLRLALDPIAMKDFEYKMLVGSMEGGRAHDVTMFIARDGGYIGIQKPMYKDTGIFRAPSGGLNPGETLEQGVKREMLEETGLEVSIDCFPLIVNVVFTGPEGDERGWTSYVMFGHDHGGEPAPRDTKEICCVKLITRDEMMGELCHKMMMTRWGGFIYRAMLTRAAFDALDNYKAIKGK